MALRKIEAEGSGVLLYLRGQEGRGIGLGAKMKAYVLQEQGIDTLDANTQQGLPADARDYGEAAAVLHSLGVQSVRLISNNPDKFEALASYGVVVSERIASHVAPNPHNIAYLRTKAERMGHLLPQDVDPSHAVRRRLATLPTPTAQQLAVASVLSATTFNLLGFTMSLPINLALRSHFELVMGASFGSLTSAYPLGVLGALFLWPRLSDKIGRKPIIGLSFAGSGLGLALQSWALHRHWSLHAFLACRVLTGLCAGAGPVAKAYLADLGASDGHLPRYMAWRDAANTMAFIAGPLIGGQLYQLTGSLAAVIGFTAASSLAAAATVSVFVREDLVPNTAAVAPAPSAVAAAPPRKPSKIPEEELLACPLGRELATAIATVCVVSSLYNCGTATFSAFFGPLVKDLTGVGVRGIGLSYTLLSSLSFLVSISIAAPAQMALGTLRTCILGLASVACGLLGMGAVVASSATIGTAQLAAFWLAAAVYQVGVPLFAPTVPTMLLQCVPRHRRGAIMGLDEAFNTVARVAAPIAFGQLYSTQGPTTCLSAASLAVFLAAVVAVIRGLLVMRSTRGD